MVGTSPGTSRSLTVKVNTLFAFTKPDLTVRFSAAPFIATIVAFLALSATGLTTFPPYYEDETWNYMAVFEAVRGNGFTWAAFGEGRALLGVYSAVVTPFVAMSPWQPEQTVRMISVGAAVFVLVGAYVLGRRMAAPLAWLPPMVIFSTPILFTVLRYGRSDVVALAFGMWSVAAAAWNRPFFAGVLSGLAVSVHPLFVWLAAPGFAFSAQSESRGAVRYLAGGLLGIAPQLAWMVFNWDDARMILDRYAVSSSLGGHASSGMLSSLLEEPRRYRDYLRGLNAWNEVFQLLVYAGLPVIGVWYALSQRCVGVLSIAVAPILGAGLLVQGKNPYYIHNALAFLSAMVAFGASQLPSRARIGIAIIVLVAGGVSTVQYGKQAWDSRGVLTIGDTTAALAAHLPRDAMVIAPNLYGGLIAVRPDLHFFNYHALSLRPWGLPACGALPARVRELVAHDARNHPPASEAVSDAYFIAQSESVLLAYLRQIYVRSNEDDVRCILEPTGGDTSHVTVCAAPRACLDFQIARMPIPSPSRAHPDR